MALGAAFSMPLIVAAVAGAIDFSAAYARKSDLQHAADIAALAGARDKDAQMTGVEALALRNAENQGFDSVAAEAVRDGDYVTVNMTGKAPTYMLGVIGIQSLTLDVESKAARISGAPKRMEVALALDVTESMANDMDALRNAAASLVAQLYQLGSEEVKISIIPYTGAVNIGTSDDRFGWLDASGLSQHHGMNLRNARVTWCEHPATPGEEDASDSDSGGGSTTPTPSCTAICGCPGEPVCGGGSDGASLKPASPNWFAELVGIQPAYAYTNSIPPFDLDTCAVHKNPNQISHLDLFEAIGGTDWGGCVEARPDPYDVLDTAPDSMDANTLFTPYFFPDDPDWYDSSDYDWVNNYVVDTAAPALDTEREYNGDGSRMYWSDTARNVWKYTAATAADMNLTPPNVTGPNRGCPDPLQPLVASEAQSLGKISSLTHRNGGGTVLSQGFAWAWRTLSPGAPFVGGAPYEDADTKKIIIIMSDGSNAVIKREDSDGDIVDWARRGDYTAYGFAADFDQEGRSRGYIDTTTSSAPYFDQLRNYLDERTRLVCDNIKAASPTNPIEIYTVLLGSASTNAVNLLHYCASTVEHHYERALNAAELDDAFERVGEAVGGSSSSRIVH